MGAEFRPCPLPAADCQSPTRQNPGAVPGLKIKQQSTASAAYERAGQLILIRQIYTLK